jgi:hypothetical protein
MCTCEKLMTNWCMPAGDLHPELSYRFPQAVLTLVMAGPRMAEGMAPAYPDWLRGILDSDLLVEVLTIVPAR